ncbi:MAG: carbon-nitrogen hydrolase family protein [Enterobacterales bacterium]|nr:carbon-nitrogen hydrolase family protein [Enterobacterales bacterium]
MQGINQDNFKLAVIQMVSSAQFQDNLDTAKSLIIEASNNGADMVVLPEYFAFMGFKEKDKLVYQEVHLTGPVQELLCQLAIKYKLWIVAGTFPIQSEDQARPFGRCYVFNDLGKVVTWYDKIHLFDVQVDDAQGSYCESRFTKAGSERVYFDSPWGKIGLAVCYDLRFPELFRQLEADGCTLFIMPAAFTYQTGQLHWDSLIKARAIENLCYFAASAQGGLHQNGRETWGHSCIVSPWGKDLAQAQQGESIAYASIDSHAQAQLRKEFPVLQHKKL